MSEAIATPAEPTALGNESEATPTPESTPAPAPKGLEGVQAPTSEGHWTDKYPSVKGDPVFKRFANEEALATSYRNLQAKMSSSGPKDPPEDPKAYFEGIERPNTEAWNDNLAVSVAKVMHEQGLTDKQGNALMKAYMESVHGDLNAFETRKAQAHEQSIAQLRQQWGGEFDRKLAEADNAGRATWGDQWGELVKTPLADGSLLGNNPTLADGLAKLGRVMGEHNVLGVKSASAHSYNEKSAQAKIDELFGPGKNTEAAQAVADASHPKHDEFMDLRAALFEIAWGNK